MFKLFRIRPLGEYLYSTYESQKVLVQNILVANNL